MIPKPRACLPAVAFLVATMSSAAAADQTATLRLGTSSTLVLARPFKSVLIDDPFIVDVHEQGDRSVVLEPLDLGAANLVFVDAQSIAITNVRIVVCKRAMRVRYTEASDCEYGAVPRRIVRSLVDSCFARATVTVE